MRKIKILWVDDEIDLLKPHIFFLEEKGYIVLTSTNGYDALDLIEAENPDIIFLDENMPGISGLEVLGKLKEMKSHLPVIMITKSEEEDLMNQAIGSKITDYLIKPVNPNQILLSLKKNLNKKAFISESTTINYRQEFAKISMQINDSLDSEGWKDIYKKLVYWEIELEQADNEMEEILRYQKAEANNNFAKYIQRNYIHWIQNEDKRPLISPDIFKKRVFPQLDRNEKVFFVLIDNFRLDQWRSIMPLIAEDFHFEEELYYSILPTATQYSRNAIFSGLMPNQIAKMFPELWVDEDEEDGKNLNESPLIQTLLERYRRRHTFSYTKNTDSRFAEKLSQTVAEWEQNDLNVLVVNFIDMLSHVRTESKMIRELASTEAAYRSITRSWFKHSGTLDLLRLIAKKGFKIVLTTDHGTIRVNNAVKVVGDKNTNTNLRYKVGKNLNYNPKEVFEIKKPLEAGLPVPNLSSTYIFAENNDFLAYPNNYNYYVSYFKNTFQHGGISLEEMLIPYVTLNIKN